MAQESTELPHLVVQLDDHARDFLQGAAMAGHTVRVPLGAAPEAGALHVLEVHSPGAREPLLLLARPVGPVTPKGYPLALALPDRRPGTPRPRKATVAYGGVSAPARSARVTTEPEMPEPAFAEPSAAPPASAVRPQDPFVGRELAGGKLLIEACVGAGGAGTVYRARHRDLHMSVAVKVMHESFQRDPEFSTRFHAEALSASRLDHPNLTRVFDFGQEADGLLYIAMEFLDGKSLRDVLDEERRLGVGRTAELMIQVCTGLTHAHARGIVHRDIKPENLVIVRGLDDDGRETDLVKVCDFGIAHGGASGARAVIAGTPEYMAPELFVGAQPDVQSDVYACGVVLYELLTGVVPIEADGNDIPQLAVRVMNEEPPPPSRHAPGIDAKLDRIVLRALAKKKEERFPTVRERRAELRALGQEAALFSSGYWKEVEPPPSERSLPPASARTIAPQPRASAPDWLETGRGYLASMVPPMGSIAPGAMPSSPPAVGSHPPSSAEPPDVARAVAPFLRQLAQTRDPDAFATVAASLEAKVRELAQHGHAATFWRLRSPLDVVAREGGDAGSRAAQAKKLLALFADPHILAPLAEKALDGIEDRERMASKVVVHAGRGGAHALYSARLKHGVFEARERFVALVHEIGGPALPVLRLALERVEGRLDLPGAVPLAEDLLKAIPEFQDDATGEIVARYARSEVSGLALAAANALPRVWGPRAGEVLSALLEHTEDSVAIAAMKGLRELGLVDGAVVDRLGLLLLGRIERRSTVRIAVAETLVHATGSGQLTARTLLAKALSSIQGTGPDVEDLVVAVANALLDAGGDGGLVAARWKTSTTWLRTRLEAVLRRERKPRN